MRAMAVSPPGRPKAKQLPDPAKTGALPSLGVTTRASAECGGAFFLMEMNTRLQVEHPVTEMLTGLDLVEWQLRVARGEPLPVTQEQVRFSGHAIEVRLCAEDERFTPHAGTVQRFAEPPPSDGLRFDHALETGTEVTPHYDAMLGKLIAHAPTRGEAIDKLAQALDATVLLGLPSNRSFLAACLRHPVFSAGAATIPFLAELGDELRQALVPPRDAQVAAALAATWLGRPTHDLPSPFPRPLRMKQGETTLNLTVREQGQGALLVQAGGRQHTLRNGAPAPWRWTVSRTRPRWCASPVVAAMCAGAPTT
jgi:geranyl-CoA carboxylase alpha subunit